MAKSRWAVQDCAGVPAMAADEREAGEGQAGAVLCGQYEQEGHSLKSAG